MSIAHCPKCGEQPTLLPPDPEHETEYVRVYGCDGCGFMRTADSYSIEIWHEAVLADLAAQERELWMRMAATDPDTYVNPSLVRDIVSSRYAYLGQNPLRLPT